MSRLSSTVRKALLVVAGMVVLLPVPRIAEAAGPPRPPMVVYGEVLKNGISPDTAVLTVKVGNEERQVDVKAAATEIALYQFDVEIDETTATKVPIVKFLRLDAKTLSLPPLNVSEGRVVRQDVLVDQPDTLSQRVPLSKVSATHDENGWHLRATLGSYAEQGAFKGRVRWYYHVDQDPAAAAAAADPDNPDPIIKPLGEKALESLDAEQETELLVSGPLDDLAYFIVVATPLIGEQYGPSKVQEVVPVIIDPSDI